jgi:hypothetical protein
VSCSWSRIYRNSEAPSKVKGSGELWSELLLPVASWEVERGGRRGVCGLDDLSNPENTIVVGCSCLVSHGFEE